MATTATPGGRIGAALASVVAVIGLSGCDGTPPDAATVRVVVTEPLRAIDSRIACLVRVRTEDADDQRGVVGDCLGPREEPGVLELAVSPGASTFEVGQWFCPGMPGDCDEDPYARQYSDGDGTSAWSCSLELTLTADEERLVTVRGTGVEQFPECRQGPT